jgi:hypothetical protein
MYPLEGAARGRLQLRFRNPPSRSLCIYIEPCLSLAARVTDEAGAVTPACLACGRPPGIGRSRPSVLISEI